MPRGKRSPAMVMWKRGGSTTTFTYSARDELLSATGPGGSITRTYYDALGRRTQLNLPNGAAASTVTTPPVN